MPHPHQNKQKSGRTGESGRSIAEYKIKYTPRPSDTLCTDGGGSEFAWDVIQDPGYHNGTHPRADLSTKRLITQEVIFFVYYNINHARIFPNFSYQ